MALEVSWLCTVVLSTTVVSQIFADVPHRKFEYKYSFKPPYLAQKDGSVPFWEYGGNCIASSENVRLAPSLRSQKGAIWAKNPVNFDWWEVDIVFRITGRGRIGADGLAFWYTQNKGDYNGEVFGSSDKWVGLGVIFDSFDNDNKHNNPHIMAVLNDGTRAYDHQNDGSTQSLASCLRDFRNKPFPTRARVEYYRNTLSVLFQNGMTASDQEFELCLRAENVILPKNGFFGLSAATGGLADDHDVLHFLTTSLHPPGQLPVPQAPQVNEEDQRKLAQEYADYQRKLDQQKEEYRKEHPDAHIKDKDEFDEWFESDNQRELRQIFQGQSQMFEVIRDLSRKLDEVIGRQERTLSLMSATQPLGVAQQHPGQPAMQIADTIRRHEVDAVLQNQNTIVSAARDLLGLVTDVRTRADTIIANQARQPTAQVQSVGYDMASVINELRDSIHVVKRDVGAAFAKIGAGPAGGTPSAGGCPTCLTPMIFFIGAGVQLVIIIAYSVYRDSKEAQAKKFF